METLEQVLEEENKRLKQVIKEQQETIQKMCILNFETYTARIKLEERLKMYEEERENINENSKSDN